MALSAAPGFNSLLSFVHQTIVWSWIVVGGRLAFVVNRSLLDNNANATAAENSRIQDSLQLYNDDDVVAVSPQIDFAWLSFGSVSMERRAQQRSEDNH